MYISRQIWTQSSLPSDQVWSALASDSVGVNLVAAQGYSGSIYYSSNSGATWQNSNFYGENYVALCQSSSGEIVYAADGGGTFLLYQGYIYNSTEYGKTWSRMAGSPLATWAQLACDSTGQYLTATVYDGQVYTSSNSGVTWAAQNIAVDTSNSNPSSSSSSDSSLSGGAIAGIVIGTLVGVTLAGVAVAVFVFGWTIPWFSQSAMKAPLVSNAA